MRRGRVGAADVQRMSAARASGAAERQRSPRRAATLARRRAVIELPQQRAQLIARVQLAQRCRVRLGRRRALRSSAGSSQIRADGRELARQLQRREARAQVLADLAFDLATCAISSSSVPYWFEQLRRGLRADLLDARNVVRAVADQREVVDDLLGEHVELGLDAGAIEHASCSSC